MVLQYEAAPVMAMTPESASSRRRPWLWFGVLISCTLLVIIISSALARPSEDEIVKLLRNRASRVTRRDEYDPALHETVHLQDLHFRKAPAEILGALKDLIVSRKWLVIPDPRELQDVLDNHSGEVNELQVNSFPRQITWTNPGSGSTQSIMWLRNIKTTTTWDPSYSCSVTVSYRRSLWECIIDRIHFW